MTAQVMENIRALRPELVEMRRHFHQHPELGFKEVDTAKYIVDYLSALGLEIQCGVAGTGVVALLKGKSAGKTIALRADMDALPITEQSGAPYASQNPGVMHACGHDAHMAGLLGAAKVLSGMKDQLKGQVKFIFQPAEEGPGGAKPMIEAGVLEGVDAIVGCHVWYELPIGTIGFKHGPAQACLDAIDVTIKGKGSHGAWPHQGIDSIVTAAQVVSALQTISAREVSPLEPVVVTIGTINGGQAYNIIADRVAMKGTVRALSSELRASLPERIERIIAGVCKAMRAEYEFSYHFGYPVTVNEETMTVFAEGVAGKIVGTDRVSRVPLPVMGGEDFAYYAEKIPGTYAWIGMQNDAKGIFHAHHTDKFDMDEDVLVTVAQFLTLSAIEYLGA
ncbi:MAG: amidohydrolase [Candidatus Korobacteraceae bacterium]|jgi:amidohydrolase